MNLELMFGQRKKPSSKKQFKVITDGSGKEKDWNGIKVNYSTKHILIATGGGAHHPVIPGQELAVKSVEALSFEELPKRAVILGEGYISVEFASIWRGMGARVDLFFAKELHLRTDLEHSKVKSGICRCRA